MKTEQARCDEIRELIEAYALGATDAEETALVERHLPNCPDVMAILADYMHISEAMLYLPATKSERQSIEQPIEQKQAAKSAAPLTLEVLPPPRPKASPPAPARPKRWWQLASAAAVLILLSANAFLLWENSDLRRNVNTLNEVIRSQSVPSEPQLALGDLSQHRVVDTDIEDHGHIHSVLAWDAETQVGTFYVNGLATSAPERFYQLWLIRGDEAVLLGSVNVNDAEEGVLLFHADEPLEAFSTFLITTEPESDATQREPLFAGEL